MLFPKILPLERCIIAMTMSLLVKGFGTEGSDRLLTDLQLETKRNKEIPTVRFHSFYGTSFPLL